MSTLSTHVLDTAAGRPASGIRVTLETRAGDPLGEGVTDADGRVAALGPDRLDAGDYVLRFDTAGSFYPEVVIVFTVADAEQHYHVPLLLSPYGYTTYRGS
ncbi:hydroxyisourate hydrolase [Jiangella alkaliphila]|uniref:5-hydroxyisourate hydrolase n=1 Tax=Jiangella alkaliphila TaxID=419479 RepID=A0A1H2LXW6_9ACTN|nr:hydroxyisourate hydrolase [Jiangella alkaliphila]SDU85451.1 5-hydroxyisourate hydrolase [Jiangella alkaliphila]